MGIRVSSWGSSAHGLVFKGLKPAGGLCEWAWEPQSSQSGLCMFIGAVWIFVWRGNGVAHVNVRVGRAVSPPPPILDSVV